MAKKSKKRGIRVPDKKSHPVRAERKAQTEARIKLLAKGLKEVANSNRMSVKRVAESVVKHPNFTHEAHLIRRAARV